jgi:hypothetical protein
MLQLIHAVKKQNNWRFPTPSQPRITLEHAIIHSWRDLKKLIVKFWLPIGQLFLKRGSFFSTIKFVEGDSLRWKPPRRLILKWAQTPRLYILVGRFSEKKSYFVDGNSSGKSLDCWQVSACEINYHRSVVHIVPWLSIYHEKTTVVLFEHARVTISCSLKMSRRRTCFCRRGKQN